jgi:Uma2 family endonuclease
MTTAAQPTRQTDAATETGLPLSLPLRVDLSALSIDPRAVVEVRSRTNRVEAGLAKMQEWMDGVARLGWYIDPYGRRVYVYRTEREVEALDDPDTLSGEEALPGFVFEVKRLVFNRYAELMSPGE